MVKNLLDGVGDGSVDDTGAQVTVQLTDNVWPAVYAHSRASSVLTVCPFS